MTKGINSHREESRQKSAEGDRMIVHDHTD
jgi:hypothetical protein